MVDSAAPTLQRLAAWQLEGGIPGFGFPDPWGLYGVALYFLGLV